jgi:hypothetical protein
VWPPHHESNVAALLRRESDRSAVAGSAPRPRIELGHRDS